MKGLQCPSSSSPRQPDSPRELLGQMIFGKCVTMALSVAAKLADRGQAGRAARSRPPNWAARPDTHGPTLYRVLRALAGLRRVLGISRWQVQPDPDERTAPLGRAGLDAGHGRLCGCGVELESLGRLAVQRPNRQDRVRSRVRQAVLRLSRRAPGRVGSVQRGDDRLLVHGRAGRRRGVRLLEVRHDRRCRRRTRNAAHVDSQGQSRA